MSLLHRYRTIPRAGLDPADRLCIELGSIADYDALAYLHYKRARPATWAQVLRATDSGEVVGVLIVSRPTLNGAWRQLAWPEWHLTGDRREAAHRLNAALRTISRVIVDPRYRGLGVGARLVRHYLRSPLTPLTEAVATMATFCRLFAAAGMRPVPIPPAPSDVALRRILDDLGVEPFDLPVIRSRRAALRRALRAWAWRHRSMRSAARACDYAAIGRAVAHRLSSERVAWVAADNRGKTPLFTRER